jgi:hypothetical protein
MTKPRWIDIQAPNVESDGCQLRAGRAKARRLCRTVLPHPGGSFSTEPLPQSAT